MANGLGLLAVGLDRPIGQMSGGQRAKVILAKLPLEKLDVLLLNEPTNFLDKEHIYPSERLHGYVMSQIVARLNLADSYFYDIIIRVACKV